MYWVKFLKNGSDAGQLDWEAIGGTWGTATSNLKKWQPINTNLPERLYEVCEKIKTSEPLFYFPACQSRNHTGSRFFDRQAGNQCRRKKMRLFKNVLNSLVL